MTIEACSMLEPSCEPHYSGCKKTTTRRDALRNIAKQPNTCKEDCDDRVQDDRRPKKDASKPWYHTDISSSTAASAATLANG
jgi:hypothetical protein